jgi:hypothetical protein
MKYAILVLFLAITGCNSSSSAGYVATEADSLNFTDSRTVEEKPKSNLPDSFVKQQEQIVFGDLRFGMTQKEVNKLHGKNTGYGVKIGNEEYYVDPRYDDHGQLYRVEINGPYRDADYLNTELEESHDNLVDVITAKYKQPTESKGYPSILSLSSGYITWSNTWNVGRKTIKVGLGELQDRSEFYAVCWIYDESMSQTYNIRQYAAKDSLKKKDASKF